MVLNSPLQFSWLASFIYILLRAHETRHINLMSQARQSNGNCFGADGRGGFTYCEGCSFLTAGVLGSDERLSRFVQRSCIAKEPANVHFYFPTSFKIVPFASRFLFTSETMTVSTILFWPRATGQVVRVLIAHGCKRGRSRLWLMVSMGRNAHLPSGGSFV